MPAVIASFIISTLAHFAVGASKSLVTTRSWWASGAEMTVVGIIEAAITYGLGRRVRRPLTSCHASMSTRRTTSRRPHRLTHFAAITSTNLWHCICHFRCQRRAFAGGARCSRRYAALSAAVLLLTASVALAGSRSSERKDLQVFNDVATSVKRYTQFTIFDDVSASVKDGVVTLTGKVTMPYKRDDIEKRVAKVDGVRRSTIRSPCCRCRSSTTSCATGSRGRSTATRISGTTRSWPNPPIHIVVEHGRVTLTGVVQSEVDRMLARSLATQFGALSVTNKLKTDAEVARRRLKSPSELQVPLDDGRRHHGARLPAAGEPPLGATLILGHGAGAGQRSAFMVDFAHALSRARRRRRHLQFSLHRTGAAHSGSRAGARSLLSRGDRCGARRASRARAARCSSAASRWAGGSRRRSRPRIRRCRSPAWCCSAIRCTRPGKPAERRDTHLPAVGRPMLFVQGTRDAFGTPAELAPVLGPLHPAAVMHAVDQRRPFIQVVETRSRGAG